MFEGIKAAFRRWRADRCELGQHRAKRVSVSTIDSGGRSKRWPAIRCKDCGHYLAPASDR